MKYLLYSYHVLLSLIMPTTTSFPAITTTTTPPHRPRPYDTYEPIVPYMPPGRPGRPGCWWHVGHCETDQGGICRAQ
jgi:hypothetical protein